MRDGVSAGHLPTMCGAQLVVLGPIRASPAKRCHASIWEFFGVYGSGWHLSSDSGGLARDVHWLRINKDSKFAKNRREPTTQNISAVTRNDKEGRQALRRFQDQAASLLFLIFYAREVRVSRIRSAPPPRVYRTGVFRGEGSCAATSRNQACSFALNAAVMSACCWDRSCCSPGSSFRLYSS